MLMLSLPSPTPRLRLSKDKTPFCPLRCAGRRFPNSFFSFFFMWKECCTVKCEADTEPDGGGRASRADVCTPAPPEPPQGRPGRTLAHGRARLHAQPRGCAQPRTPSLADRTTQPHGKPRCHAVTSIPVLIFDILNAAIMNVFMPSTFLVLWTNSLN